MTDEREPGIPPEPAMEVGPAPSPEPETIVDGEPGPEPEPELEPIAEAEPGRGPDSVLEPAPQVEPPPEEPVKAPVAAEATVAAEPLPEAPLPGAPVAAEETPDQDVAAAVASGGADTVCRGDGTCGSETCTCKPPRRLDRRAFLGFGLTIAAGVAGAAALSRLAPLFAEPVGADASPIVPVYDPERVAWTFVVDSSRCIGCGLCVAACKEENNLPEDAHYNRTWVERYVQTADGALEVDSPEGGIDGFPPVTVIPGVAAKQITNAFFAPRLCMQCAEPPCVGVCPVSATYVTPEGIVLVDDARCIGCAYCVVACPYGARYLIPATERTPLGIPGVADKCTWCYHRIARGLVPACVEVCPVGARKFGDRNDPESEVAAIMQSGEAAPLWPEYGTEPRLYYLGPMTETA